MTRTGGHNPQDGQYSRQAPEDQHVEDAGNDVPTLTRTIDRYIAARLGSGEFRERTARGCRYDLYAFAHSCGDRQVHRVQARHITEYLAERPSDSTRSISLSRLRTFYRWCVINGYAKKNPCDGIRGPRRPPATARGLKAAEIATLYQHAPLRLCVAVSLGLQEGLRRGEIVRLSTSSIDWDDRVLYVQGKGGKERIVPLSDETAAFILAYLEESPAGPHVPLLRSERDGRSPITPDWLGAMLSDLFVMAGVKRGPWDGKSAHALRHTCANDMLDQGANIADIQLMLGHAHLSTTANVYLKRVRAVSQLRRAAAGRSYVPGAEMGRNVEAGAEAG